MSVSERELIAAIRGRIPVAADRLVRGIGDDCAVYRLGGPDDRCKLGLITTDALVASVHFDLSWHPPGLLGRKALSVNVSDIAAMGGRPCSALLTLGFSRETGPDFLQSFLDGFHEVLAENKMVLMGGDTVKSPTFFISVTVLGEVDQGQVLYRSGAGVGDLIWVSGPLGQAAAGLELCRRGGFPAAIDPDLLAAHLDPGPRVRLGQLLAGSGLVTAMMDLSDGIATDLAHLCAESGVGAELVGDALPLSAAVRKAAARLDHSALDWALQGGEDYQLLFTAPPASREALEELATMDGSGEIFCVGRIVAGQGVILRTADGVREIGYHGFEHSL
jgi:thiamine-monophosphate kinase